jgi:hypothetical protein
VFDDQSNVIRPVFIAEFGPVEPLIGGYRPNPVEISGQHLPADLGVMRRLAEQCRSRMVLD